MENKFLRNATALTKFIGKILTFIGHALIFINKKVIELLKKARKSLVALKHHELTHRIVGLLLREITKERDYTHVKKVFNKIITVKPPKLLTKKKRRVYGFQNINR